MTTVDHHRWLKLLAALITLKLIIYIIDPDIMYFLDDSNSYLETSVSGWPPPDRSYYYGLFIRLVTSIGGSLGSLVLAQVLLSTFSAFFTAVILVNTFNVRFATAVMAALMTSVEPIQLLYERYVMTETVSLFCFVLFLYFILTFIKDNRKLALLLSVLFGFFMIKFRMAYLPVVVLCLLAASAVPFLSVLRQKTNDDGLNPPLSFLKKLLPTLLIVTSFLFLQSSTKLFQTRYGQLPTHSETGFFLLSSWAPVLKNNTIPFGPDLTTLLDKMPFEHGDINLRNNQRWTKDCLIDRLRKHFSDDQTANAYTLKAAGYLLLHDPLAVIGLGMKTYGQFFDLNNLDITAAGDRGNRRPRPEYLKSLLKDNYGIQASEYQKETTLTGNYFQRAKLWYMFIMAFPFLLFGLLLSLKQNRFVILLLAAIFFVQLSLVILLATITTIRHLQPLAWMIFLFGGLTYDRLTTHVQHSRNGYLQKNPSGS